MPGSAHILEGLVQKWLRESALGASIMADARMSLDEATDAVFELLNAGHLKIRSHEPDHFTIEPRMPPRRPLSRVERPHRRLS
jgi:hypothetical protein